MRPRADLIGGIAVVALLLAGCQGPGSARGPLAQALAAAPGDAFEASFVDWSSLPSGDRAGAVRQGLADDTLTRSAIAPHAQEWEEAFGFSPQRLTWELTAHSDAGSLLAVGWGLGLSKQRVEAGLAEAGFERVGERWEYARGGSVPVGLASVMKVVEVDPAARRLVAVDDPAVLTDDSLLDRRAVRDAVAALGTTPDTALFLDGPGTCAAGGVEGLGRRVEEQGQEAARRAGGLREPVWSVRAVQDDRFEVALAFEAPASAAQQARVRERLTTGPFIGRAGTVDDVVSLAQARAEGNVAVLSFTREPTGPSMMSTSGALLFAGCDLGS